MNKPAPASHPIHDLIARRWSPCSFDSRPVEREQLLSLFEAARWAPSSYNDQPWRFIVAQKQNAEEFAAMLGCLVEANQQWAKHAPVLMIAVAARKFARNGNPNRHGGHDVGLALSNLALQATSMGLFVHMMAGFEVGKTRQVYGIGEDYEPMTAVAIGYPGDPSKMPESIQQRDAAERSRRGLETFVFSGSFGQAASFIQ